MNEWFKKQAKKMEKEILDQQTELRNKKEIEKMKEEEKKKKKKESKLAFKLWKEKKDEELKQLKEKQMQEKMLKELESKSKHSTFNHNKGFTIGPYTDAGALKEIQRFVNEKCTEEGDEEEGIVNDDGEMAGDEEMTPEQLEELQKLQQMQMNQMNQYQVNGDENENKDINYAGFNNQELEENNYENYYQQQNNKGGENDEN